MRWRTEWTKPSIIGAVSFGVGVCVGYGLKIFIDRRYQIVEEEPEQEPELDADDHIEQLKFVFDEGIKESVNRFNNMITKATDVIEEKTEQRRPTIDEIAAEAHAHVSSPVAEEEPFFAGGEDMRVLVNGIEWDWDVELANRTPDKPYVLHRDEFYADEMDCGHISIMYYEGDDVLADDGDVPIYDRDKLVGPLMFGHGSGDENCFYVRNEKLDAEFEVTRDPGSYYILVLGGLAEEELNGEEDIKHFRYKNRDRIE